MTGTTVLMRCTQEDEDSNFSSDASGSDEESESASDDDDSDFSEESEGSYDEDEEDALEEKGMVSACEVLVVRSLSITWSCGYVADCARLSAVCAVV
jgi:hypothetical protein